MKHVVYALVKNKKCVYIGCTSNIKQRLANHRILKDFDKHRIIKSYSNKEHALLAENAIIRFLGLFGDEHIANGLNTEDTAKRLYL